jgi:hypothetical protein
MALQYSPKIVQESLVMCLDASQNKSYPTDLPVKNGLLVWLDAADDSTFSYSSGTEVSQWRDKSGNNFHANQATTANQPSRNTVVNSRKSVNFTSTNGDRLRVNSGMVFTNSVTAIVFIKPGSQNYAYANILDQDHGMDGANGWVIQRNNTASAWLSWVANAAGDTWFNPNQILYVDNTSQIVTLRKGSSTVTLYSNGTSSTDVAIADQQIRQVGYLGLNLGSWRAGNEIHGSSRHYNGEICEVVVYNRALSLTELKQVHTYLGQKWGISNTDRSIIDLSNNNNHGLLGNGTVANMPTFNYYNKSLTYNKGESDTLVVTNSASFKTNNITIELYMKFNSTISSNTGDYIQMGIGSGVGQFYFRNENPNLSWNWYPASSASSNLAYAISNFSTDTYYLITLTGDSAGASKMYVNGSQVASAANVGSGITTWTTNNLTIGGYVWDGYSNTDIALTRIYSRVLSSTEIAQNYEAQKSKFANTIVQQGLVLNLDAGNIYSYAGAGTTFYDVSGNGKIGTLTGGVTYSSLYGGDFILDGVNGYIQTDLNQNTDNAQITWEAWFWDNSAGGFADNTAIISNYGAVATTPFTILHISSNGYPFFGQRNSSATEDTIFYSVNICDSQWHQIVGVVDGSSMYLYVDGVLRGSKAKITGTTTSGQNLVIGGNHLGRYQSCRIASARCYNIALSAAQVLQNYNATKGRFGL